jgi:hypothetical protein
MTSKKGEPILPESGDWALMIDATPVMNYLGNMVNGNTSNASPTWGYPGTPLAITGKMFKDEKTAYRGMIRLGFGSMNTKNFVMQDGQTNPDPNVTVEDSWKSSYNSIVLGGGLEMRRGKTRLQGFYGGMLMIGLGGSKDAYSYGNAFSSTNQTPNSTTSWSPITNAPTGSRTLENKAGSTFMLGIRGFIGAEYFIFPKMAVGAEFGWGIGMSSTGDGEMETESWDAANNAVKTTTSKTAGSSSFGLDTDINGGQMMPTGALTLTLHF